MTNEEIIALAKRAGWSGLYVQWAEPTGEPDWKPMKTTLTVPVTLEQITRFAHLIATKTREEDAEICFDLGRRGWSVQEVVAAIRARKI